VRSAARYRHRSPCPAIGGRRCFFVSIRLTDLRETIKAGLSHDTHAPQYLCFHREGLSDEDVPLNPCIGSNTRILKGWATRPIDEP